jgi:hypothetical protein
MQSGCLRRQQPPAQSIQVRQADQHQPRQKLEPSPERLLALLRRWQDEAVRAGKEITRIALAFALISPRYSTQSLRLALICSIMLLAGASVSHF